MGAGHRCSATAIAIVVLLALRAPASSRNAGTERVTIRTEDGVTLAATWYEPSLRPAPAVILVHMYGRDRRDWDPVARRFAAEGIGALAVDLRGHGESSGHAPDTAEPDLKSMTLDVKASRRYLGSRGDVEHSRIGIAAASLGATLAVLEAATDPAIASLALLSPSLDYRGLRIDAPLRKFSRPVLLVASDDDPYAQRSAKDLQKAGGGVRELLLLNDAGHGTTMTFRAPELAGSLVDWFRRTLL